jgi:hypothetical protein
LAMAPIGDSTTAPETLVILFNELIEISFSSHRHACWVQLSTDLSTPIGSVGHDARCCVKYGRESPSVGSRVTKTTWLRRMCRFVGPCRLCREAMPGSKELN